MLDAEVCYRALRTRDPRFDGRFFVAVRSTGVFCRPICPARTPKRENCRFLPTPAAAREAGFRPCLRCRPEAAPGSPAAQGTSATVARALRLIDAGALDGGDVDGLAERLGVGSRHLRRLFAQHLGASPRSVAQTRRVLFAKKLIDETSLPMVEVALTAGYASVRRFNDALRQAYGRPPRELRRRALPAAASELTLELAYRPPLAWPALLAFLAARAIPGVEAVSGDRYRRTFCVDGTPGWLEARPAARGNAIAVRLHQTAPAPLAPVVGALRRLFDLDADPAAIAAHLAGDALLAPSLRATPGLRVPGAFDGFELGVRAILGQQVSVRGATTLAGRLVERFGEPGAPVTDPDAPSRLFPAPERLRRARVEAIGLPAARAGAIRALATAVDRGEVCLDGSADPATTRDRLLGLPGIGPWTADYLAMRALREPDAFPAGDLALRKAANAGGDPVPERAVADRAEAWRPWRAYAALHLWASLSQPGHAAPRGRRTAAKSRPVARPRRREAPVPRSR